MCRFLLAHSQLLQKQVSNSEKLIRALAVVDKCCEDTANKGVGSFIVATRKMEVGEGREDGRGCGMEGLRHRLDSS